MEIIESEIHRDYFRAVMYAKLTEYFEQRPLYPGTGIEFGERANGIIQKMCPGTVWEERAYPQYDIAEIDSWSECDVVIADQVLEHVYKPWQAFNCAGQRVKQAFIVTVPFLLKVHADPSDFWRMTPDCIRELGKDAGFTDIHVDSWGNPQAEAWLSKYLNRSWNTHLVIDNNPEEEWRNALIENDPVTPIMIWAVLRR